MSSVDKSSSSPENPSLLTGRNWLERLLISLITRHTPKMPGGGKALTAINGRETANCDADQIAVSLSHVRVVPALRKAAPGTAEN
jgi:hypothetical protein